MAVNKWKQCVSPHLYTNYAERILEIPVELLKFSNHYFLIDNYTCKYLSINVANFAGVLEHFKHVLLKSVQAFVSALLM